MWVRRSALFLYLNARCFNGLWRTNSLGTFNVPYGKLSSPRILHWDDLAPITTTLRRAELIAGHYGLVLAREVQRSTAKGVAIYADPPYDGTFDGYAKGGFDEVSQRALAAHLDACASKGAAVWASNSDTPLVREIYAWAQIERVDEHHSVGSKAERRGKRGCVLIRGGAARQ
jgi:DNA adenine methylase